MSNTTGKNLGKKTGKRLLSRAFGAANLVFSVIPDTAKVVGKIVDNSTPIIDKELQRRHDRKAALIQLPDVVDMSLPDAQEYLKSKGFTVHSLLAKPKPRKKFAEALPGEVLYMSPRSGRFNKGHLVKIYYADKEVIGSSQELLQAKKARDKETEQSLNQLVQQAKNVLKNKK